MTDSVDVNGYYLDLRVVRVFYSINLSITLVATQVYTAYHDYFRLEQDKSWSVRYDFFSHLAGLHAQLWRLNPGLQNHGPNTCYLSTNF